MTAKQMIETFQQHHPHVGETEAIKIINDAFQDFVERTEIWDARTAAPMMSVANQLHYDMSLDYADNILKVLNVYVDNRLASRLTGILQHKDTT